MVAMVGTFILACSYLYPFSIYLKQVDRHCTRFDLVQFDPLKPAACVRVPIVDKAQALYIVCHSRSSIPEVYSS